MSLTSDGGKPNKKDLPYSPPVGPKGQTRGPGLGQDNYGNCGTQGQRSSSAQTSGSTSSGRNRSNSPAQRG